MPASAVSVLDVTREAYPGEAMIKVSVMYPYSPGTRFDHDYYRDKHLPLIKTRMGAALKYYTIDKGRAGSAPGAPPAYVGMCHLLCDSVETYHASFGPHAQELSADVRNFTDRTPVTQISEVVVENSAEARTERRIDIHVPSGTRERKTQSWQRKHRH